MKAEDKFGTRIKEGDTVHFVYGGDHHEMKVEAFSEINDVPHVRGKIAVYMRDGMVTVQSTKAPVEAELGLEQPTVEEFTKEEKKAERSKERKRAARRAAKGKGGTTVAGDTAARTAGDKP